MATKKAQIAKQVEALTHDEASRTNIPTAEYQAVMEESNQAPVELYYPRNTDLDPQLVWRGKDEQAWTDLVVQAPPLFIQEKVHPKVLIDDLLRYKKRQSGIQVDLFDDFNGLPSGSHKTEFYQHDANWSNRMILGDSLRVMSSLVEREGLRGKIQCIYIDPPYGIKFNSNFQWSTTTRILKDGKSEHITREPEQVKAFRDTWRDGIHSYLSYLYDRLFVARDLLKETGSIFVQIGDENVHRVRLLMDEVFGEDNFVSIIPFRTKTRPLGGRLTEGMLDFLLFYAKSKEHIKFRPLYESKNVEGDSNWKWFQDSRLQRVKLTRQERNDHTLLPKEALIFRTVDLRPAGKNESATFEYVFQGRNFPPPGGNSWLTNKAGMTKLAKAARLMPVGKTLERIYFLSDYRVSPITNLWTETRGATDKIYVVQTNHEIVKRCILMTTDPSDLVLDPTCGSGTTAYVAEQWGRRWITIDTSRVALALTRARIMGACYPYFYLHDSVDGQRKESEINQTNLSKEPTHNKISQGFVYERVPHVTIRSIVKNTTIDVIWNNFQITMEPLRQELNSSTGESYEEWEIPHEPKEIWSSKTKQIHAEWWEQRVARQREIDSSIVTQANYEYLYDKPYIDKNKVRVSGPFTVESISPYRMLGINYDDDFIESPVGNKSDLESNNYFTKSIIEHLKMADIQQTYKEDKILISSVTPWPGQFICAEALYRENNQDMRAAIFVGPEFGTVSKRDLVLASHEAAESDFNILISLAFNYDALASELGELGKIPILRATISPELHMSKELKNTGKGNLFVIFGEPDIEHVTVDDDHIQVHIKGVDVFDPATGLVRSEDSNRIACWFIDTDYNEESFFVRQAYFLGSKDTYKSLKYALQAEINREAWATLHSDTSRPFPKPNSGLFAVKVINHLGDEVMKVFRV